MIWKWSKKIDLILSYFKSSSNLVWKYSKLLIWILFPWNIISKNNFLIFSVARFKFGPNVPQPNPTSFSFSFSISETGPRGLCSPLGHILLRLPPPVWCRVATACPIGCRCVKRRLPVLSCATSTSPSVTAPPLRFPSPSVWIHGLKPPLH
jgi:hypothetical protein